MIVSTPRARGGALATVLLGALLLGGCTQGSASDLDAATAAQLQEAVVLVAHAAADGEHEQALAELDALQRELDLATAGGRVSGARPARIQTALDDVRAELETRAGADADPPGPAVEDAVPTETTVPEPPAPAPTVAPAEEPAGAPVPAPAPVPESPAPGDGGSNGNGNGPGSNNGNGNGPDSNNGKGNGSDKSSGNNGKGKG
ncbi:hypothetical protein [Sanguibacter suaedae]|uniref:Mucin-associated surface protein n=1 Tax=Sanguibacter suaedae TaxID=2795737 RepID=A0A934I9W0_9MICO|nr:hypothetical protein [Sanguibacter suaedae]MBI9114860.1 hypothetical protein [Sanguibacter suaedae]